MRDLGPVLPDKSLFSGRLANFVASHYGYFVLCILLLPLLVIAFLDRRAWPWDEAFYARYSFSLFRVLTESPAAWPDAMVHALGDRAPALVWIGQFFVGLGYLLPYAQTGLLLAMLTIQAVSVFLLYRALRTCFGHGPQALLACSLVITGSLFTGLTYRYFVDPLQITSGVWLLVLAASRKKLNSWIFCAQFCAAILFGLLVKTSTPLYQLPLIVYLVVGFLIDLFIHRSPRIPAKPTRVVLHLLAIALLLLGTVAWYWTNFANTYQHVVQAASGDLSIYYGHRADLMTKFSFWSTSFVDAFLGRGLAILLLLLLALALFNRFKGHKLWLASDTLALLSAFWIVVILFLFSRTINEDTRYLIGLAPYVAVLAAWICQNARSQWAMVVFAGFILVQFGRITRIAFGLAPPSAQLSGYLVPYVSDATVLQDSLFTARVTADVTPEHPVLVGCETAEFDSEGLSFYRVVQSASLGAQPPAFLAFDWTRPNADDAWTVASAAHPKYFAYRKNATPDTSVFNHLSEAMLAKVQASKNFRLDPQKSNPRVSVYEALSPDGPSADPAQSTARRLPFPASDFRGVNPNGASPFGFLDYPQSGAIVHGSGRTAIAGWSVAATGIDFVEIQIDKRAPFRALPIDRPDVKRAYPALSTNGFKGEYVFDPLSAGPHTIQVISHAKGGQSRRIASVTVSIEAPK